MAFPLIILGAGASYDYMDKSNFVESHYSDNNLDKFQPPLTNFLFDTVRFYELIEEYKPYISDLASYINTKISGGNTSFEQCLTDIKTKKTKINPETFEQLVALRFYIADLMFMVSDKYYKVVNNYANLIQLIKNNGGNACFVNFNYDLLLEKTLNLDKEKNINKYIGEKINVIKIHGSCNWFYHRIVKSWGDTKSCYDLALVAAQDIIENEEFGDDIVVLDSKKCKGIYSEEYDPISKITYLPAVALPLDNKDNFICPKSHIESLKNKIDLVDRIIIIGWRAADQFLIELLQERLKGKNTPIAIVSGKNSKDEIMRNLGNLAGNVKIINQEGFTNFMKSGKCETFLEDEIYEI